MAEKRQSFIHTGPVGGRLTVRDAVVDLSAVPIFVSFSRRWDEAGDVLYPATVTEAYLDAAKRISGCIATVQVGPTGAVQLPRGRWFIRVHVTGLSDGSAPIPLSGAVVIF